MATESELRQEIADERRELTDAVTSLRAEIDHTAERGKHVAATFGILAGAALTVRTALRIRRRLHGDD
jgi:hypothetical protein